MIEFTNTKPPFQPWPLGLSGDEMAQKEEVEAGWKASL